MRDAWTVSLEALGWVEQRGMNEDAALRKTFKLLEVRDRAVAEEASRLVYAVQKRMNLIDYIVKSALDPIDFESLEGGLGSFLRLYAYLSRDPNTPYSEVHEFAERVRGTVGDRKFARVEDAVDLIPHHVIDWGNFTPDEEAAYRNFLPIWYVRYIRSRFGVREAGYLIQSVDTSKYIRVNTLKVDNSLISRLRKRGFDFEAVKGLSHAFRVVGDSAGLTDTEEYREGAFILQDKASILVGEVAAPRLRDVVLDVCAAPGVKTTYLAQMMGNSGKIISVDSDARRLASWQRLVEKMGVMNVEPLLADAAGDYREPVEADLVTLDPPCSGTGTLNNIPSSKWRLTLESIQEMAMLQKKMIEKAATHVKDGGALVYSTCSITVEENEEVIAVFLREHPEFKIVEAVPRIGEPGLMGLEAAQRLYPSVHDCEGFFIARLENTGRR